MKKYTGIFPALVTPFDSQGKINASAIGKLVESTLAEGVSGFYVGGSTGESYLLSMAERKYLLECVMEAVNGRADVICNIGLFSTEHGMELAEHAGKEGVSAISSVPPFYFPFSLDEYYQYYQDLADAAGVPVLVYNVPDMSGIHFTLDDIERFLKSDKVAGLKHTSYDLFQLEQVITDFPNKTVFVGHDEILLSALSAGASAAIGTTFNIMPQKGVQIMKAFKEGNFEEALTLQKEMNNVIRALCDVGVFKGVKAILKMQGIDCGECRKPFLPLRDEQIRLLRETAEKNHILKM